jgi:filamentous hemagglutinin family protein
VNWTGKKIMVYTWSFTLELRGLTMKTCTTLPLATLISFLATSAPAEVTLDGTLGRAGALPGPNYQIGADLGQQHGGNLFHSFRDFNLQSHESATFSGPANVQNVISRVTGGNPSSIDGTLRSTIPNADLYFLNSYGIMFGPNAKLDLQGGFHASTADYLRLQDGGRFEARYPNNSLLTVAPVAAFGFLTETPATITTQDSTLLVPPLKPLSLIGGNLQLQGTLPVQFDDSNTYATFATSLLKTTSGTLHLVAVGSSGEVLWNNDLTLTGRGGDLTLTRTLMDTSGPGSGNLKIRGGRLQMHDSTLQANTLGEFDGGVMDIQLTESLHADSEPYYFSAFASKALGRGKGGSIAIRVPEFTLDRVRLNTNTLTEANAGSIDLEVTRLNLLEGAALNSNSLGYGKGGSQTIKASESVLIAGHSLGSHLSNGIMQTDFPSFIGSSSFPAEGRSLGGGEINLTTQRLDLIEGMISIGSVGKGNAGNIFIQANNINITEGGMISTSALNIGLAGNIKLDVTDTLFLSGRRAGTFIAPVSNTRFENNQSSITSFSLFGAGGQIDVTAKTIHLTKEAMINTGSTGLGEMTSSLHLQADNFLLTEGGQINSSNGFYAGTAFFSGHGRGGDIHVQAKQITLSSQSQYLQRTGIFSDTYSQGLGGNLYVQTGSLDVQDNAAISARSYGLGGAGQIKLQAQYLHLAQHGSISTAATQAGGGDINLVGLSGLLYLDRGEITTSVATGQGGGGNITIEHPQFVVMNQGQIVAQADAGHGGNIHIVAQQFLNTPDSLISASSRVGLNGQVRIDSPDQTIGNTLLASSKTVRDITGLLPRRCEDMSFEEFLNRSTFYVYPIAGSSLSPYDLKPSHAFRSFPTLPTAGQATVSKERRAGRSQRLAWLTGCHS